MGLENIPSDGKPDVLNNSWPVTGDPKSQGDDHLRGIKTVLKNFYTLYLALKGKIEGYFDADGNAKHTINSTKLGGETPAQIRDATKLTGVADAARFPTATVLEPGIMQLSSTLGDDETKAATPKLVKQVADQIGATSSNTNVIGWTLIPLGNGNAVPFSQAMKDILNAGSVLELVLISHRVPGRVNTEEHITENVFLVPTLLDKTFPYYGQYDSQLTPFWKIHGKNMAVQPEKILMLDINCTFVYLAFRRCKSLGV